MLHIRYYIHSLQFCNMYHRRNNPYWKLRAFLRPHWNLVFYHYISFTVEYYQYLQIDNLYINLLYFNSINWCRLSLCFKDFSFQSDSFDQNKNCTLSSPSSQIILFFFPSKSHLCISHLYISIISLYNYPWQLYCNNTRPNNTLIDQITCHKKKHTSQKHTHHKKQSASNQWLILFSLLLHTHTHQKQSQFQPNQWSTHSHIGLNQNVYPKEGP